MKSKIKTPIKKLTIKKEIKKSQPSLKLKLGKDWAKLALAAHSKNGGKIELASKMKLETKDDLSIAYTPGIAAVCLEIAKHNGKKTLDAVTREYTLKRNTIAVLSDGSAVLGLGNIGANASIPVMEGKAAIMKAFADVDAFPICINTQNVDEIVRTMKNIESTFGGVNLEDVKAPECFELEEKLKEALNIPVMHDDQWGAATVTITALHNALKVVNKKKADITVAVVGAGAAGIATIKMLHSYGVKDIIAFDTRGSISLYRSDLNKEKKEIAVYNVANLDGQLSDLMPNFDVFIGLSKPKLLTVEMIKSMKPKSIIFALANPEPEIMPDLALSAGAAVVATGRSDFPNQINNSLFFPGFWRGMLDRQYANVANAKNYDLKMLAKVAEGIANMVKPVKNNILPSTLNKKVHKVVAGIVRNYK
jgi:malate dehydrogenase (oxaloacetate-decarboxylating)